MKKYVFSIFFVCCFLMHLNTAHASIIFAEDFDGSDPGFESWTKGSEHINVPIMWDLFKPNFDDENKTTGSGNYAAIRSDSDTEDVINTEFWLSSPIIDVANYKNIALSIDIFFQSQGLNCMGEDQLAITLESTNQTSYAVDTIGMNMTKDTSPLSGTRHWDISLVEDTTSFRMRFAWESNADCPTAYSVQLDNVTVTGEPAPVPEPATMLLLASGLIGLSGLRRKNK